MHIPCNLAVPLGEFIYGREIVSCTIRRQPYSQCSHTCSCQMTALTYMVPCMIKVAGRCISEADTVMCALVMQEGRNLRLGHKQKPPWVFVKEIRFSYTNSDKNCIGNMERDQAWQIPYLNHEKCRRFSQVHSTQHL